MAHFIAKPRTVAAASSEPTLGRFLQASASSPSTEDNNNDATLGRVDGELDDFSIYSEISSGEQQQQKVSKEEERHPKHTTRVPYFIRRCHRQFASNQKHSPSKKHLPGAGNPHSFMNIADSVPANDAAAQSAATVSTNSDSSSSSSGPQQPQHSEVPQQEPRRKKITRLIPTDETLPAIEEGTERSEDSFSISASSNGAAGANASGMTTLEARAQQQQQLLLRISSAAPSDTCSIVQSQSSVDTVHDAGPDHLINQNSLLVLNNEPKLVCASVLPVKNTNDETSSTGTAKTTDEDDDYLGSDSQSPRLQALSLIDAAVTLPAPPLLSPSPHLLIVPVPNKNPALPSSSPPPKHPSPPSATLHSFKNTETPPTIFSREYPSTCAISTEPSEPSNSHSSASKPPLTTITGAVPVIVIPRNSSRSSTVDTHEGSTHRSRSRSRSKHRNSKGKEKNVKISEPVVIVPTKQDTDDDDDIFDLDVDNETGAEDIEEALTWRLDPSLSLSDWTIIVHHKIDEAAASSVHTETYYVHKNILAVGPKKSDFFVQVFRAAAKNGVLGVGGNQVTEFELEAVAANAFPSFLDYMYETSPSAASVSATSEAGRNSAETVSDACTFSINTANAAALRHLANILSVKPLHKRVMEFIQKDLNLNTIPVYFKAVVALRDEKLLRILAKYCAKNIMKIEVTSHLLEAVDSDFMVLVASCLEVEGKEKKTHFDKLLLQHCRNHLNSDLTEEKLLMLTDEKYLSVSHPIVALQLLELESAIIETKGSSETTEMTPLQSRCFKIILSNWKDISESMDYDRLKHICRKLPSSVVTDLFLRSLQLSTVNSHSSSSLRRRNSVGHDEKRRCNSPLRSDIVCDANASATTKDTLTGSSHSASMSSSNHSASNSTTGTPSTGNGAASGNGSGKQKETRDRGSKRSELTQAWCKEKRELEMQIEKMKQEHGDALAYLRNEYETNLVKLRDILLDKDKQISTYWQEIKSFQRLPNVFEGKLAATSRQHEATVAPDIARGGNDGYLYVVKRNGPKYPLYYYNKEADSCNDKKEKADTKS